VLIDSDASHFHRLQGFVLPDVLKMDTSASRSPDRSAKEPFVTPKICWLSPPFSPNSLGDVSEADSPPFLLLA
jgi:hypothetical protein